MLLFHAAYMALRANQHSHRSKGYDGRRVDMRASGVQLVAMASTEALARLTRFRVRHINLNPNCWHLHMPWRGPGRRCTCRRS